jgi:hypothetical protein
LKNNIGHSGASRCVRSGELAGEWIACRGMLLAI